ncbi:MAG: restriction endonuclease subunit S [Aeromonas sp.]
MTWPMVKLGEIFKITSGGTPSRSKSEYYENGSIAWIKTGDLHNKFITHASEFITEAGLQSSSTRIYPKNTILVAMYGATIGACSILKIEACTNQACAAFTPNEKVDTLFLYYLLKYSQPKFINAGAGGAQPNISATFLKNFEIPLPPLDEQKRIAAILDKADAIRQKRQQAIALADDFLRSVFLDMFGDPITNPKGWERIKLGDLISSGPTNGLYKPSSAYGSGTRILRIDGFYDGVLSEQEYFKRVEISKEEVSRFSLIERGIVINRVNSPEYLGKCAFIDKLHESTVFESNMMFFTVDEELLNPVFLTQQLQMPNIKHQIKNCSKDAVNQSSINQQDVKSFEILLPNVELQNYFEAVVNEITRGRKRVSNGQSLTDTLFNSISHKVFSGQL